MRANKFLARATGMGRRPADAAITAGRLYVNGQPALVGQDIRTNDRVEFDGKLLNVHSTGTVTILLHKPAGYVVSRNGQGSKTVYDLLPAEYHSLKPIGRLDKDSSGLLLLTNDGTLANELTHPGYQKTKIYEIVLHKPLQPLHHQMITDHGIMLADGLSKFQLERLHDTDDRRWRVIMHEGRKRQIRRTFTALDYTVVRLHRTHFGSHVLDVGPGTFRLVPPT